MVTNAQLSLNLDGLIDGYQDALKHYGLPEWRLIEEVEGDGSDLDCGSDLDWLVAEGFL